MYLQIPSQDSLPPEIFCLSGNSEYKRIWEACSTSDGTAILLQGATSLAVDKDSWKKLAALHCKNVTPTKVIVFEKDKNPLVCDKGCYDSVGGGYSVVEYDLALIGDHLRDRYNAPKQYALLFRAWEFGL